MRGKHRARAINRDTRAAEAAAIAIEKERDQLREQIRATESEASDLTDVARRIHRRLTEITLRDGAEAVEVWAQAEERVARARELTASVDWRRQQLRRVARRVQQSFWDRCGPEDRFRQSAIEGLAEILKLGKRTDPGGSDEVFLKHFADRLGVRNGA